MNTLSPPLHLLSSMATRALLSDLAGEWERLSGVPVRVESVGGVDAARRVRAGEVFDVVVLAADALDALAADALVQPDSRRALVESAVAVAVPAGRTPPDIGSEAALQQAVRAAGRIGYSTGPSGTALLQLFERWGWKDELAPRLVQARPGVPVGRLVAEGEVDLGFQQLSELQGLAGITLLGGLPPGLEIITTFAGAVGSRSARADAARQLLAYLASGETAKAKTRHGMTAPRH